MDVRSGISTPSPGSEVILSVPRVLPALVMERSMAPEVSADVRSMIRAKFASAAMESFSSEEISVMV